MNSKRKTVPLNWLSKRFRSAFDESVERLDVVTETERAYLLSDGSDEGWVPKKCVDRTNSVDPEEERRSILNGISIPLEHTDPDTYKGLLGGGYDLFDYQTDVVYTLSKRGRKIYLGADMGTGKTIMSLSLLKLMTPSDQSVLLICKKSLMNQWRSEIHKFAPEMDDRFDIINYDMIFRESAQKRLSRYRDGNFSLLLEEVACLGHEDAKRTLKCMSLAQQADMVLMLSGSMFGGHFENAWPCTRMQGFTWSRDEFDRMFIMKIHQTMKIQTRWGVKRIDQDRVVGYKNIPVLIDAMAKKGAVFVRSADYQSKLPKAYDPEIVTCRMSSDARDAENRLFSTFETGFANKDPLALQTEVKMANCLAVNRDKQQWVKDALEDDYDRWIFFYTYSQDRDWIVDLCKKLKRPYSEVSGRKKDLSAYDQHDDSVTIIQAQAGAEGLNLQKCNRTVFCSPITPDQYMQARRRTLRAGQTRPCLYYVLMTDGRFDASQWRSCEDKMATVDAIG